MRNIKRSIYAVILISAIVLQGIGTYEIRQISAFSQAPKHEIQQFQKAKDITSCVDITISDKTSSAKLKDNKENTFLKLSGNEQITLKSTEAFSSFYIKWNKIPGKWKLKVEGKIITCGTNGFLHEYGEFDSKVKEMVIIIPEDGAQICDIFLFTEGELPKWVQIWEPPYANADMLVLPTHSDDEQLFFAGVMPYYAGECGLKVQVIYMTNHWRRNDRPHELLNGLWTVGIRAYPIVSEFPDDARSYGSRGQTGEEVLKNALTVYDEYEVTKFQVEMIRRFRPLVIVGHDINGEYGHGAHRVNSYTLTRALEMSYDPDQYPESAEEYGTWDVPKTYLHLWNKNKIVMNWDIPLAHFNGKTAFEMAKLGYACHISQQGTRYTKWISQYKASEIKTYNPCLYGLYRSMVGEDEIKDDFFEKISIKHEEHVFSVIPIEIKEASKETEESEIETSRQEMTHKSTASQEATIQGTITIDLTDSQMPSVSNCLVNDSWEESSQRVSNCFGNGSWEEPSKKLRGETVVLILMVTGVSVIVVGIGVWFVLKKKRG